MRKSLIQPLIKLDCSVEHLLYFFSIPYIYCFQFFIIQLYVIRRIRKEMFKMYLSNKKGRLIFYRRDLTLKLSKR